jgi:hypothetical protein
VCSGSVKDERFLELLRNLLAIVLMEIDLLIPKRAACCLLTGDMTASFPSPTTLKAKALKC